jgi:hypothetical protein
VNCGKLSDNWNNSPKRENPSCLIVFDKRKDYPSSFQENYSSTKREGCSTSGNIGREGIPGIIEQENQFHFFHKNKESCNTIGNCLTI